MLLKNSIIYILLFFIHLNFLSSQETPWGTVKVISVDQETKKIKFSYSFLNEFFYINQGKTDKDFTIGNDQIEAEYSMIQEGKLHLTKINIGQEYMTQANVNLQSKYGFAFSDDIESLYKLMDQFVKLTHQTYHPNEYFKSGTNNEETLISYLSLLGKGYAYYGQHNSSGIREGIGTYIMSNRDSYRGTWKDDTQNGTFVVTREGEFRAKGNFAEGIQDGVWKYVYNTGDYHEKTYELGKLVSEKNLFKKENPELRSDLEYGKVFISCYTEKLENGVWKEKWPAREKFILQTGTKNHTLETLDVFDKLITHQFRLVEVEDFDDKKVETFDYTFLEGFGHSSPTISIFRTPQQTPDGQNFDILFNFESNEGTYKYFIQFEDEQLQKDKELKKQMEETIDMIQDVLEKEEDKKKEENEK